MPAPCLLPLEGQMRVDRSITTARSDRTDDLAAAQASFDRHLQAARDGCGARDGRAANDNTNAVTVKRGDTLSGIARQHGVSMADLYRANPQFNPNRQDGVVESDRGRRGGWDPDYVRPGDRIRLHARPQPHPPSGHPRHPPPEVCPPGGPNTRTPTPNGPNASGTPSVPTTPNAPTGPITPTPNAQNT